MIRIIGTDASPYTRKVRVVAMEKRIEFQFDVDNPWGATTRVPQFNPLGRVPVVVLEDGTSLYDSRVIAEYLDNASPVAKLIPAGNRERIEVKRWEALADGVLDSGALVRFEGNRLANMRSQSWIDRQLGKILGGITEMERLLGGKTWCTGNAFCLADICVGCCLAWIDFRFHKLPWRGSAPSLDRLLNKLQERHSFAATPMHD